MPYTPFTWVAGVSVGSALNMNHLEIQYDQAVADAIKLTVAETEVYNAAAPTGYTDLDLSGVVGANIALVLLKIKGDGSSQSVNLRTNGDPDAGTAANGDGASGGGCTGFNHFLVATDAGGIIEWIALNTDTTTIDIVAYIK